MFAFSLIVGIVGFFAAFAFNPFNVTLMLSSIVLFLVSIKLMSMDSSVRQSETEIKKLKQRLGIDDTVNNPNNTPPPDELSTTGDVGVGTNNEA